MSRHLLKTIFLLLFATSLIYSAAAVGKEKVDLGSFRAECGRLLKEWKVPGMAVAIVKDGKVVFSEGFGFRDIEKKLPVTPHTLFAIGSCSKAFTAMDVGILVDEGKVEWDKPLRSYLPAFKLKDPVASEGMTPRDLLCHRSGLPRHDLVWYGAPFSRQELFERLQYLESSKSFRSLWQYQNLMFMTAGILVEKLSASTWESFTRERILLPSGMNESNFSVTVSQKSADFTLPYAEVKDKFAAIPFRNIDAIGPAGSINSNAVDMAKWLLLNLNGGKAGDRQVVSQSSLSQLHMPQMVVQQPLQYDELLYNSYGMGWMIGPYRGRLLLQHGGGIDGFTAFTSFMPREKLGVVVLANMGGTPLPQIVALSAYDRLLGMKPVPWSQRFTELRNKAKEAADKAKKDEDKDRVAGTSPSHALADYAGDYEHPAYGVVSVALAGDKLQATFNSFQFAGTHYHYDVFKFTDEKQGQSLKAIFNYDRSGIIHSLAAPLEPAAGDIVFTRMAEKKMFEKEFLKKFVGTYAFTDVAGTVRLRDEKTLILSIPGQPEYELVPYQGTTFSLKGLTGFRVEFKLDAAGTVTEMVSHQPNGSFTARRKD